VEDGDDGSVGFEELRCDDRTDALVSSALEDEMDGP
jgi:hypothetical protein